jgi:phosphoenolpyruvate carboxylase
VTNAELENVRKMIDSGFQKFKSHKGDHPHGDELLFGMECLLFSIDVALDQAYESPASRKRMSDAARRRAIGEIEESLESAKEAIGHFNLCGHMLQTNPALCEPYLRHRTLEGIMWLREIATAVQAGLVECDSALKSYRHQKAFDEFLRTVGVHAQFSEGISDVIFGRR